ncbi:hypothetical protein GQ651_03380 [Alphaproteobacteria bacterium GH1-50]|uniref:Solute-binding protein family 5 domain-containing protein n=1 Tax=Kangsaoukella pontilimi TaxID=2691042 RepID=A0A7C9J1K9_9RHOB|nr:ABC transporter substrate-binding protein [Kangsaoukella pontilimi]MXQ06881.1 hypothetical protein [Kangsaoukella pontilimi]
MSALATGVTMPTAMSLASRAEAAQPRAGGHLRIAVAPGPDADALLAFATGNALVERTPEGRLTGDLAEAFHAEENGRVWHVALRSDVTFHDGTPLDTGTALRAMASVAALPEVEALAASGPRHLMIRLTAPDSLFAERLAEPAHVLRLPSEDGTLLGTGPYRVDHSAPDKIHLTRRADGYWKPGRANVDEVTLSFVALPAARQAAVMSGEVDYAAPIPPETVAFLKNLPGIDLAASRGATALMAGAADTTEGARALDALRGAVPRADVLGLVLAGQGRLGDDTPWPVADRSAPDAPAVPQRVGGSYGLASGTETTWARQLSGLARARGLDLTVFEGDGAETAPLYSRVIPAAEIARLAWTPALAARFMRAESDACNALTGCLSAARATLDAKARAALLDEARTHVARSGRVFLPAWSDGLAAHRTALHHGRIQAGAPNDGHRMIERWWFA